MNPYPRDWYKPHIKYNKDNFCKKLWMIIHKKYTRRFENLLLFRRLKTKDQGLSELIFSQSRVRINWSSRVASMNGQRSRRLGVRYSKREGCFFQVGSHSWRIRRTRFPEGLLGGFGVAVRRSSFSSNGSLGPPVFPFPYRLTVSES